MFLVFTFFTGLVFIFLPIFFSRKLSIKWGIDRKIFWKSGLCFLFVDLFYLAAMGNLTSVWPDFENNHPVMVALVFAVSSGLFFELGRFLVLDKIIKSLRSFKEGVFFGIAWRGLETLILGAFLLIGVFAMQFISSADVTTILPGAGTQEIQQLSDFKNESIMLIGQNPLMGFSPLLQHAAYFLLDIVLSLIMILALIKGSTPYIWGAVALRTTVFFTVILSSFVGSEYSDLVLVLICILPLLAIKSLQKEFPKHLALKQN